MDMTALTFADGEFDVVLDKCAMDALLVDEGQFTLLCSVCSVLQRFPLQFSLFISICAFFLGDPWNPKQSVCETVDKLLKGVSRRANEPSLQPELCLSIAAGC